MQIIEKEDDLSIKERLLFFEAGYMCVDTGSCRDESGGRLKTSELVDGKKNNN